MQHKNTVADYNKVYISNEILNNMDEEELSIAE